MFIPKAFSPLGRAWAIVRSSLWVVAFFSFFINLLTLTGSLYMLQVYDRVLASRSTSTLLWLTLFAASCLATMAVLDIVRSRLLVRMSMRVDAVLSDPVFASTLNEGRSGRSLRDVEQLRLFSAGPAMLNLLDAPWAPFYIAIVYVLHPWLGHVALLGGLVLIALGLWNEWVTRKPLHEASNLASASNRFAEVAARNSEAIHAMGMLRSLNHQWKKRHQASIMLHAAASDAAGHVTAAAKAFRLLLQVAILGVGAWLVILDQTTAGAMVAASIIMGRGLAPLEGAIGSWRQYLSSREAYLRLALLTNMASTREDSIALPKPSGRLEFADVAAVAPGQRRTTLQGVRFNLGAGQCLGITGPSGSGKSTVARLAVGVWRPVAGAVRLDGANIADWPREDIGPHIGYLPQDIELFPGTVAQNIARLEEAVDAAAVVAAAQLAGAHAMILSLKAGYETKLGPNGENLSGGQRQRIGLARALYRLPPLVVLDEPTAHLDAEGETLVRQAIDHLRRNGSTVVVIAHRPAVLAGTDQMMVIVNGQMAAFAPTSELMPHIMRRVVSDAPAATSSVPAGERAS